LDKKKILLISPQSWGHIKVSKHHYAIELAKRGYEVSYLPPPTARFKNLYIQREKIDNGLHIIKHSLFFPFIFQKYSTALFNLLLKFHVYRLRNIIGNVDIVWSFTDLYPDLRIFNGKKIIYHQVDNITESNNYTKPGKFADLVIGVTDSILDRFNHESKHLVNHGLSAYFLKEEYFKWSNTTEGINVCYCGNLTAPSVDYKLLIELISNNKEVNFHFIGPYENAISEHFIDLIDQLKSAENVKLYGKVHPNELSELYQIMDAFILCYDRFSKFAQGRNRSSNSHKILEYLSTGRVVISTNMSTYNDKPGLLEMLDTDSNEGFQSLFSEVITNIEKYNSKENMEKRINYARSNTYENRIAQIERLLIDIEK